MDKKFDHKQHEKRIYKKWEESGAFRAEIDPNKTPYTIVLPPPNASGKMHTGNILMIAIEDLLIRWKRMQGYSALWLPGTDHAGFETQITFEKMLKKEGKSRFNYDRQTLYNKIMDFVKENKHLIEDQIRDLGAGIDWSRYTFTLDDHVVNTVYDTFKKMIDDRLIYRDDYMVNYCPKCGTTFADLEIIHKERKDPLYYVKYPLEENTGEYITVATTRPEPIFVDTHLAVNPKDQSKKHLIGKRVLNPLTGNTMDIIADSFVDPEFGTGVVKLTPAHDKNDYEVAKTHNLPVIKAFSAEGIIDQSGGELAGLKVDAARKKAVEILQQKGLLEKIDENYVHTISQCYKGEHDIEPTILPNWFVEVDSAHKSFKKPALDAVKNGDLKIYPKWQQIKYIKWMEEMHDWPISRQVVWGIRIPAWYNIKDNPDILISFLFEDQNISGKSGELLSKYSFEQIESGLQSMIVPKDAGYVVATDKPGDYYLQDTDTFDTWFSSGQWPLVTLRYPDSDDFKYFYPTSVLETGWEIIRFWVSRMVMFGIYLTGKVPFYDVYLHGLVRAMDGRKMSKSLGNIINPDEYMEKYGVDALRMGLISGTANGKDFNFPRDKIISYRNFANKIWNMGRFLLLMFEDYKKETGLDVEFFDIKTMKDSLYFEDKKILVGLSDLTKQVNKNLEKYRFADAADSIYHFMWDELADKHIELLKSRKDKNIALSVFRHVYLNCLKLLHPFMPFVTEAIWQEMPRKYEGDLIVSLWPE